MPLHTLSDSVLIKIFSYVGPKPRLYMNAAATCKRLYMLCTSDRLWARFNVHKVENVYRHFLEQSSTFSRSEIKLYTKQSRSWYKIVWSRNLEFDALDLYTQLMIILDSHMYCEFENKVHNCAVMQLGIGMPGNLIFYGSPDLKQDPDLAWHSLSFRQHKCFLRCPWQDELELAFALSFANLDSEFKPPYSTTLYSCNPKMYTYTGPKPNLSYDRVSDSEKWRIDLFFDYPNRKKPQHVRYKGQDLLLDEDLKKKLETDEALQGAAIRSGVDNDPLLYTNKVLARKRYAQSGCQLPIGSRWGSTSSAQLRLDLRNNCFSIFKNHTHNPDMLYYRSEGEQCDIPSLDDAVRVVEQNHHLYKLLRYKFKGKQKAELKRANARAKLWGRNKRPESILHRQREWYLLLPLHRPIVPTIYSKGANMAWFTGLKDVYPQFPEFPSGQRFARFHDRGQF